MSQSRVLSLVSENLMRSTFSLSSSSSTRFIAAAKFVSCKTKTVTGLQSLTYTTTRFINFVSQTGQPEIQLPGSEEELPSRPSRGPEINPLEYPPEVTTFPSDPPPLGPPQNPSPEFPVPPSPSPPMPDTPNIPEPETPPDVVPPIWEPPHSPPPEINPPPPMGPTVI